MRDVATPSDVLRQFTSGSIRLKGVWELALVAILDDRLSVILDRGFA